MNEMPGITFYADNTILLHVVYTYGECVLHILCDIFDIFNDLIKFRMKLENR